MIFVFQIELRVARRNDKGREEEKSPHGPTPTHSWCTPSNAVSEQQDLEGVKQGCQIAGVSKKIHMSGLHQTSELREAADNIIFWMGVQLFSFGEDYMSA